MAAILDKSQRLTIVTPPAFKSRKFSGGQMLTDDILCQSYQNIICQGQARGKAQIKVFLLSPCQAHLVNPSSSKV